MTGPWRSFLERGVDLFNRQEFFEAHEAWEDAWRDQTDVSVRSFLQGLIQVAAGFVKWQRRHPRGMAALLERGAAKLERFPPDAFGLNLGQLLESVEWWRRVAAAHAAGMPAEPDPAGPPRLVLGPDPGTPD